jgi:ABC-type uncharacterized transport system YnjBCD permease subunit
LPSRSLLNKRECNKILQIIICAVIFKHIKKQSDVPQALGISKWYCLLSMLMSPQDVDISIQMIFKSFLGFSFNLTDL